MQKMLRLLLAGCLLFTGQVIAQVHITFLLDTAALKPGKNYYLAGNVNGWNPSDSPYSFINRQLTITANRGDVVEFKITNGSWESVETSKTGADVPNRIVKGNSDTTVIISIAGWKNEFGEPIKKHTASKNVTVLDTAFAIPQLHRNRAIRIYLPPDYATSRKRYPVLYMSDGQNCFDEFTGSYGEWQVDETLDHFYDSCKKSLIVVAVDHGESHRLQEYDPYDFERFGKGEGKEYASFLVETLKPFIDSAFRTIGDKRHTHIAGSSMGAVLSTWALIAYPSVFGNAGIFSPAYWTAKSLYTDTKKHLMALTNHSVFLYAGGSESKNMVSETKAMYRILQGNHTLKMELFVDEMAQHNEAAWRKWFPVYLQFILK